MFYITFFFPFLLSIIELRKLHGWRDGDVAGVASISSTFLRLSYLFHFSTSHSCIFLLLSYLSCILRGPDGLFAHNSGHTLLNVRTVAATYGAAGHLHTLLLRRCSIFHSNSNPSRATSSLLLSYFEASFTIYFKQSL